MLSAEGKSINGAYVSLYLCVVILAEVGFMFSNFKCLMCRLCDRFRCGIEVRGSKIVFMVKWNKRTRGLVKK